MLSINTHVTFMKLIFGLDLIYENERKNRINEAHQKSPDTKNNTGVVDRVGLCHQAKHSGPVHKFLLGLVLTNTFY